MGGQTDFPNFLGGRVQTVINKFGGREDNFTNIGWGGKRRGDFREFFNKK